MVMEFCAARSVSSLPRQSHKLFSSSFNHNSHLRWNTSLLLKQTSKHLFSPGSLYYTNSSIRSITPGETSSEAGQSIQSEPDGMAAMEGGLLIEKKELNEIMKDEMPKEDFPTDDQFWLIEFLEKLNIKLNSEDLFSVLLLGGGALIALWLATAIVGAIDSIPLFPKLLETVGLGYTIWFTNRYLIFKENREELATKVEEIMQVVIGSTDD